MDLLVQEMKQVLKIFIGKRSGNLDKLARQSLPLPWNVVYLPLEKEYSIAKY